MYFLLWTRWRAIEQENIHLSECDGSEILHYPSMHNEGVVEVLQPAGMSEDCGNLSQQDCWLAAIRELMLLFHKKVLWKINGYMLLGGF